MHMPGSSKKGGQAFAFPDACKTPPAPGVPVPYPNMGSVSSADKTINVVLIENKDTVVLSSKIPNSSGDDPGVLKGLVSNTHKSSVKFKKGSSKVYAKGKKVVHHLSTTSQNGSNSNAPVGSQVKPSQTKVLVAM
ncbi:DUF4150 domain-containing protein [Polyangium mundeleinium]|uniref:DUF4150 domain-containing protein n=1 Tax=Polyangium mundeleinium TaxID=2995306 RepID=A0ABT5ELJ2_9BACT|nr:DUF4150 domain-containing protein [Polyangium mundeleinium]MDC0741595.1 DUF4150 domain-containing protein [Polyangium mundeleinium]